MVVMFSPFHSPEIKSENEDDTNATLVCVETFFYILFFDKLARLNGESTNIDAYFAKEKKIQFVRYAAHFDVRI